MGYHKHCHVGVIQYERRYNRLGRSCHSEYHNDRKRQHNRFTSRGYQPAGYADGAVIGRLEIRGLWHAVDVYFVNYHLIPNMTGTYS